MHCGFVTACYIMKSTTDTRSTGISSGETAVPTATTELMCKDACVKANQICVAFDFNAAQSPSLRCFIHISTSVQAVEGSRISAIGYKQYMVTTTGICQPRKRSNTPVC